MKNRVVGFVSIAIVIGGVVWFAARHQSSAPSTSPTAQGHVALNAPAPAASFINLQGTTVKLSSFKGKKVLFWFISTWCSSCSEGARVLAQNESTLGNLTIIPVETYHNDGYPGPSINSFIQTSAPATLTNPQWVWGRVTASTTSSIYNPDHYADIYYLIDAQGVVRAISGSPAATTATIRAFANS
ncbi:MAG: hypothetical protein B7X04_01860 [Parcubacteria group bacterium 21-54-25]|nr:MAG: hypothetical protein B7X04_01860 [Parcubacteria group bacterium 21-54-25]HQU07680.1 redoxin family protein [Candidatus Paceibacterota bacterium]